MMKEGAISSSQADKMLGKSAEGRLRTVLQSSPLRIIGEERRISTELSSVKEEMISFNRSAQELFGIFLATPKSIKSDFTHIDQLGIQNLALLVEQLTGKERRDALITMRTIFGATETKPFRALEYLLPALHLAQALHSFQKERGGSYQGGKLDIQVEFVFMDDVGATINNLSSEKITKSTRDFATIARAYVDKFYPEMSCQISFLGDTGLSQKLFDTESFFSVQKKLFALLKMDNELSAKLQRMESRHGNEPDNTVLPSYITYAALHPLMHDYLFDTKDFVLQSLEKKSEGKLEVAPAARPDLLISIGAQPEATFYRVRQHAQDEEIVAAIGMLGLSPQKAAQYIANIHVPPYLQLAEGDLLLNDVVNNPQILRNAFPRARNEERGMYQIPVQKAVAALSLDVGGQRFSPLSQLEDFFQSLPRT